MPTPNVKSATLAGQRYARRAAAASGDYKQGVETTGKSWAAATAAGAKNYMAGVTEAAGRGAFEKGVTAAGDAKWKKNAMEKGPGRYAEGVQVGMDDYQRGVQPYLEVISRTDLPMRGPTGSESNYQRVTTLGRALRQAKTGRR